jgi:DnaJ-class molecular chaperone
MITDPCKKCRGKGRSFSLSAHSGFDSSGSRVHGTKLRVTGEGEKPVYEVEEPLEIYLWRSRVKADARFERQGFRFAFRIRG